MQFILYTSIIMSDIHNRKSNKIDEMRSRLYDRGAPPPQRTETRLTDEPEEVASTWDDLPQPKEAGAVPEPTSEPAAADAYAARSPRISQRRKKFRRWLLLSGVAFFVGALVVSTLIMFMGNNNISAENISISVNGPFTIGGGETLPLQIGVTNANAVPISAATLIIDYPDGTRNPEDNGNLFIQRIPLETIRAGETINVPARAVVYGEENSDQQIEVSIEYRVEGSNATFFREAEPFQYKISSAPVVLEVDANQSASSGQETDIELRVSSNSQNVVENVLVRADYPDGFDYTTSDPSPVRGQNTWRIEKLEPGETQVIALRGAIIGNETDELAIHFSLGTPEASDPTALGSVFNTATTELLIEQPFVGIELELDGEVTDTLSVEPGQNVNGRLSITNSLSDIIYDTEVSLQLGGNALSDPAVSQTDGFYDSLENVISWDPSSRERLTELEPGETIFLNFSFAPDVNVTQTPVITLEADLKSSRIRENRVPETLTGSAEATVRVATMPTLIAEARRTSGPVPPTVDGVTTYTLSILAETASNNLNNVVVTAPLPQYVTFEEPLSEQGTIAFNETNRTITWRVGNVEVGQPAVGSFSISYRPSVSQIGKIPDLLGDQQLRAEDAFTGSVVRTKNQSVTTELSTELGFDPDNGRVIE